MTATKNNMKKYILLLSLLPGFLFGAANDVIILKKNAANTANVQVVLADPGANKLIGFNNTTNDVEYFDPAGTGTVTSVSVTTANGVSGSVATATTTPAITLTLGAITPTTVGGNTFTAGSYTLTGAAAKTLTFNNTLTLAGTDGTTMTFPATSATLARTDAANTFTGIQSMTSPAVTTSITTGSTSFTAWAGATTLLTIGGTGASASLFVPSTLDTTSSTTGAIRTSGGISAAKAANIGTDLTVGGALTIGSGASTAGVIGLGQGTAPSTGTTNVKIYAPTSVTSYIRELEGSAGSTGFYLGTVSGTTVTDTKVGFTGTGSVVLGTTPTINGTTYTTATATSVGYIGMPQNSQSAAYTTVLADQGKHILHPTADNNARTFTIDSNANVAYPVGTVITVVNQINTVTIAITSDTLTWFAGSGTASTGSRSLAAGGVATLLKVGTTSWIISGPGVS